MIRMLAVVALMFVGTAGANDGWSGYAGIGFTPTPRAQAAPEIENSAADDDIEPGTVIGLPGLPGPQGPQGQKGDKGEQGPAGTPADLCSNIPGIQPSPGKKYNAQRFWSFLPKWEQRYLAINHKRQLVCVTLRWIRNHIK